eukprot:352888-Chlamydomonas_euryale.AAC.5
MPALTIQHASNAPLTGLPRPNPMPPPARNPCCQPTLKPANPMPPPARNPCCQPTLKPANLCRPLPATPAASPRSSPQTCAAPCPQSLLPAHAQARDRDRTSASGVCQDGGGRRAQRAAAGLGVPACGNWCVDRLCVRVPQVFKAGRTGGGPARAGERCAARKGGKCGGKVRALPLSALLWAVSGGALPGRGGGSAGGK